MTYLCALALCGPPRGGRAHVTPARGGHALLVPETNVQLGRRLARRFGWVGEEFSCLYRLWNRESGWQVHDRNWSSEADGIPQANPASKMASAGPRWRDDAETQIRWGLGYIKARYGHPCGAWSNSQTHGYY